MANTHAFIRPDLTSDQTLLKRLSDGAIIPLDMRNQDYNAFLAAGSPADAAPAKVDAVVLAVRPVAIRYVLRHTTAPLNPLVSMLAAIETSLQAANFVDQLDAWTHASMIYRADLIAMVGVLGQTLGITTTVIDTLMKAAANRPDSGAVWGAP